MPTLTTRDMNKIGEMFDQSFYQLMERVDRNYEGGGQLEPPKPKKQPRTQLVPENLVIQQQQNILAEMAQRGAV